MLGGFKSLFTESLRDDLRSNLISTTVPLGILVLNSRQSVLIVSRDYNIESYC